MVIIINITIKSYMQYKLPCASISLHGWGGTHSGQSTPHYCPPLIHLHSPPPWNGVKSQSHELNLNLRFKYCDLLD